MKNRLHRVTYFLILFITFFFQSSPVLDRFSVAGVKPDIVFVLLFIYALFLKDSEAVFSAVAIGTFTDLIFGKIYGISTLIFLGFLCLYILLKRYIYTESKWVVFVYCFVATFAYEMLRLFINTAIWGEAVFSAEVMKMMVIKGFYNGIICIPVFCLARRILRLRQEVQIDG